MAVDSSGKERPLLSVLADAHVIVNGILQDTDAPIMYMQDGEEARLRQGALIVDVSCDLGMGFPFARPTSFADPMFACGPARYYAVDHTPSYLWRAATWEISRVICEYLPKVMQGPGAWTDELDARQGGRDRTRGDQEREDPNVSRSSMTASSMKTSSMARSSTTARTVAAWNRGAECDGPTAWRNVTRGKRT